MKQWRISVFSSLALLFLLCTSSARADELATVAGYVTDPSGLRIAGAKVQATNIETNVSYSGESNSEGLFRIGGLPTGSYRVVVQKTGFKTTVKQGLELHVQDIVSVNFQLDVGSVAESVTVAAEVPLVNTESAAVSTVIDRNFVENLPLNGRSFNTLMQLTPGVVIAPSGLSNPGQFSIAGQRTDANSFQVDGVSANFGVGTSAGLQQAGSGAAQAFNAIGGTSSLVSVDAMQEFRVQTSSFAPEYGRTPGGQVSIATRSGTNSIHGDVFDYFRNTVLDANDWFANAAGKPRGAEHQNDFGGVVGGPIFRDKTFFFLSYEGFRLDVPQTTILFVPSTALRTSPSTVSAALPYLNAYPVPGLNALTSPDGSSSQYTQTASGHFPSNAVSLRLDHSFGTKAQIFGRYNYAPSSAEPGGFNPQPAKVDTQTATLGFTYEFNQRSANSARLNYSTQHASQTSKLTTLGGATPPPASSLIPSPFTTTNGLASFIPLDGNSDFFLGTNSNNHLRQSNFVDDYSFLAGSHQLKFGVDYRRIFLSQKNFELGPIYESFSLANFAQNATPDFTLGGGFRPASLVLNAFSSYAQDSWKMTQRLTLTYGVRWEFNPPPNGANGTTLASWENVSDPATTALAPAGTPVWKTTYANFAPRVGVAYSLTRKGDFVLRAGWGVFYDLGTETAPGLLSAFPNLASTFAPSQPLPYTDATLLQGSFSPTPPYSSFFTYGYSSNLKLPFSYQWNVALEKSFAGQQSFSVTYVGQEGERILRREAESQPNPTNFQPGSFFFPTLNGDVSNYEALQLQFKRPISHGLQALLNYTFSHSIDTSSDNIAFNNFNSILAAGTDRASSDYDVRHNFTGTLLYQLPGYRRNSFLKHLTSGWTVDSVIQARGGFPLNVQTFVSPIPGTLTARPDLTGQPIWLHGAQCASTYQGVGQLGPGQSCPGGMGLNPNAFIVPTQPRQGNLGRNAIRGFGFTQIDFSAHRDFAIGEKLKLGLQGDVFNLLNHPNFGNPDGSLDFVGSDFGIATHMLNVGLGGLSPLYQIGGPRSAQLSLRLTF